MADGLPTGKSSPVLNRPEIGNKVNLATHESSVSPRKSCDPLEQTPPEMRRPRGDDPDHHASRTTGTSSPSFEGHGMIFTCRD